MAKKVIISESQLREVLKEENLSKSDINRIVKDMMKTDKEVEKRMKNIAADVVRNLYKVLWQKYGMYDADIRK